MPAVLTLSTLVVALLVQHVQAKTKCSANERLFESLPALADMEMNAFHSISFLNATTSDLQDCFRACVRLSWCASLVWQRPQCQLVRRVLSEADLATDLLVPSTGALYWQRLDRVCPGAKAYTLAPSVKACLRLHLTRKTWDAAKAGCESEGASLVVPDTLKKREMLWKNFMTPDNWVWLGTYVSLTRMFWLNGYQVYSNSPEFEEDERLTINSTENEFWIGLATYSHYYVCEIRLP